MCVGRLVLCKVRLLLNMAEGGQLVNLPNWFIKNYLIDSAGEFLNKNKWLIQMSISVIWLSMASISLFTTELSITRTIVSVGLEVFGEYVHQLGSMCEILILIQDVGCRLIHYQTYRSSNRGSHKIIRPLKTSIGNQDIWERVLQMIGLVTYMVCVGVSTYSAYVIYDKNVWLILYKMIIGMCCSVAFSPAFKLQICNGLFLYRTCQELNRKILKLYVKLLDADRRNKRKQVTLSDIMSKFKSVCVKLANYNSYWKKIIFVVISTYIPIIPTGTFTVLHFKSVLLVVVGVNLVFLVISVGSLVLLIPAYTESKLRKCYPLMCRLLRYRSMNWMMKLKLLRLVKQFDNQISFTSWDTNKLDYMDYYEVSR